MPVVSGTTSVTPLSVSGSPEAAPVISTLWVITRFSGYLPAATWMWTESDA